MGATDAEDAQTPLMRRRFSTDDPEETRTSECITFGWIFQFPLPSSTTEADEADFREEFLHSGQTHQSRMNSLVINPSARSDTRFHILCDASLKSMRNATIEMFESFFTTLCEGDPDCRWVKFTSVMGDSLFFCVKLSDSLAEQFADLVDYPLQLNTAALQKLEIKISKLEEVVPAYVRYDAFQKDQGMLQLHAKPEAPQEKCVLRRVDRIRLLYDKLIYYMHLPEMELMGLISCFPCHNQHTLRMLKAEWGTLSRLRVVFSMHQPIDKVRNYFGEEVAFYFLFVQEVAFALLLLMPAAGLARVLSALFPEQSGGRDLVTVFYSLLLMVGFPAFNRHWARTEAHYGNLWGMDMRPSHFEVKQPVNPKFVGELVPWDVNENELVEIPIRSKRLVGLFLSGLGELSFVLVIMLCASYTQYTAGRYGNEGHKQAQKIAALALSGQIQVFGAAWNPISTMLTDLEQHVTVSSWHQAKARKAFTVGFFNTFFSFFYVGFVSPFVDPQADGNGLLQTNMEIVYGTYMGLAIVDIVWPWGLLKLSEFLRAHKLRKQGKGGDGQVGFVERQAKLLKYTGEALASDYMQVCFPLAFVVMFSAVMPLLTVFLAFVTLILQLRADAWKLLNTYRRPFPEMADGIGLWNGVMQGLEIACIFVNLLLLLTHFNAGRFTTHIPGMREALAHQPVLANILIFVVSLNVILFARTLFMNWVPSVSANTRLEKKRQRLQRLRLVQNRSQFKEQATMWAEGNAEMSAFDMVPPLKPGDPFWI
mmetsp:Transcript_26784/g.62469  ORF Transcript_26784/g.62469 Transcript_26784/m.62469 type:complete len:764 (+) Transcript_26784:58-2349(+)